MKIHNLINNLSPFFIPKSINSLATLEFSFDIEIEPELSNYLGLTLLLIARMQYLKFHSYL